MKRKLRVGDWVEVRTKSEILATLDERGQLDGLPFMPEMLQFSGRRFKVFKRAHKTCDTVNHTGGRRMTDAVHLEELRCGGMGHGGCQAGCLIFRKDAWLKRVAAPSSEPGRVRALSAMMRTRRTPAATGAGTTPAVVRPPRSGFTELQLMDVTRRDDRSDPSKPIYVCQATQVPEATTPLHWWDVRQYVEDYRSGNVGLRRMSSGFVYMGTNKLINLGVGLGPPLRWLYNRVQAVHGGVPYPRTRGTIPLDVATPSVTLDLQPGEVARVKSFSEVLGTLNIANKNRGMYFDAEEVPYCGHEFEVRSRVNRIVDERTGEMITFGSGSVILEGAYCPSRYSEKRMFCPRGIYPFWREAWLERVEPTDEQAEHAGFVSSGIHAGGDDAGPGQ